jgi:hypothetical protein
MQGRGEGRETFLAASPYLPGHLAPVVSIQKKIGYDVRARK